MIKKMNRSLMKSYLKYLTYTIAVLLLIIQIISIFSEEKNNSKLLIKENILSKSEYCERINKGKYIEYLAKCFIAFFSGCLLSESRFLRTGII